MCPVHVNCVSCIRGCQTCVEAVILGVAFVTMVLSLDEFLKKMPGVGWWIMFYRVLSGHQRAPVGANKTLGKQPRLTLSSQLFIATTFSLLTFSFDLSSQHQKHDHHDQHFNDDLDHQFC